MSLPPKAVEAANEIAARVPNTKWTPQDRDLAAALIGKYTKQEKALDACIALNAAVAARKNNDLITYIAKMKEAKELARLARLV